MTRLLHWPLGKANPQSMPWNRPCHGRPLVLLTTYLQIGLQSPSTPATSKLHGVIRSITDQNIETIRNLYFLDHTFFRNLRFTCTIPRERDRIPPVVIWYEEHAWEPKQNLLLLSKTQSSVCMKTLWNWWNQRSPVDGTCMLPKSNGCTCKAARFAHPLS